MNPSARIGNLLYNEAGEVTEVVSITKTHINGVELSKWSPIPITEEWLVKMGFSLSDSNKHIYSTQAIRGDGTPFNVLKYRDDAEFNAEHAHLNNVDFIVDIPSYYDEGCFYGFKYVHQIQNLHFDLTGTDLQIQL